MSFAKVCSIILMVVIALAFLNATVVVYLGAMEAYTAYPIAFAISIFASLGCVATCVVNRILRMLHGAALTVRSMEGR